MPDSKPSKEDLEKLTQEIRKDQAASSPAEKRLKLKTTFKKAVKKIVQTPPPKKKDK